MALAEQIGVRAIMNNLMTLAEISEYLGLPEETIYKYARHGRIPASKIGRFWRFDRLDIDRWVAQFSNRGAGDIRVLVVDDDELMRNLVTRWLDDAGCVVESASSGAEALDKTKNRNFEIIFLDLMMPGMTGPEALAEMKAQGCESDIVILTSHFDSQLMDKALENGPLTLIRKPVEKDMLQRLIRSYHSLSPAAS
jgi:excisionase family DNA binding protein